MTDAPNPSAKTEEHCDVHHLLVEFANSIKGASLDKRIEYLRVFTDRINAFTHPQPSLSVGLDREAVARVIAAELCKQDYDPHADPATVFPDDTLSWAYIDQGGVDFGLIADAILALAAPAEGYVLVPVEKLEDIVALSGFLRQGGCDAEDLAGLEYAVEAAVDIASDLLPAAPTGGRS